MPKPKKKTRRDRTVKLLKPPLVRFYGDVRHWDRSLPFFRANAGILFHRVAYVQDFLRGDGKVRHTAVHYLCNNTGFVDRGAEFVADPTKAGRLVCSFCEFQAKHRGMPSADELVGHHVHVGRLRAVQSCCCDHNESN